MDGEKRLRVKKNVILSVLLQFCLRVCFCFLFLDSYYIIEDGAGNFPDFSPTFYPRDESTSYAAQVKTGDFNMFQSFANS